MKIFAMWKFNMNNAEPKNSEGTTHLEGHVLQCFRALHILMVYAGHGLWVSSQCLAIPSPRVMFALYHVRGFIEQPQHPTADRHPVAAFWVGGGGGVYLVLQAPVGEARWPCAEPIGGDVGLGTQPPAPRDMLQHYPTTRVGKGMAVVRHWTGRNPHSVGDGGQRGVLPLSQALSFWRSASGPGAGVRAPGRALPRRVLRHAVLLPVWTGWGEGGGGLRAHHPTDPSWRGGGGAPQWS